MRLIRRTEQIIEGSPAEIAALHQAHVDGFHPEPPAMAPAPQRQALPASQPALLFRCSHYRCGYSRVVAQPLHADELCPACRRGSLWFADYTTVQMIAAHPWPTTRQAIGQ